MKTKLTVAVALATALVLAVAGASRADEVTDWHLTLWRLSLMTNPNNSPFVTTRVGAIFSAAVFDAVNDGRYAPVHVPPAAPPGPRGAPPPSRRPTPRSSSCSRPASTRA